MYTDSEPRPHNNVQQSSSIPPASGLEKANLALVGLGVLILAVYWVKMGDGYSGWILAVALSLISIGSIGYSYGLYRQVPEGIQNNGVWHRSISARGALGWILGVVLTGFYILLYWWPQWLGLDEELMNNRGLIALFDPLSKWLKGQPASQWFVYGVFYTLAILLLGIKFIYKYRHNKYQIVRTLSVMFFQLGFAFLIPELLLSLNLPYNDFKNMWPLNYYFFDEWNIQSMLGSGRMGLFMLFWGIAMIFLISPVLTYFFGKRWYCSWVCGCGGLAETAGDPFRHLSDKSLKAWQVERWLIHLVLVLAVVMTIGVLYGYLHDNSDAYLLNKKSFAVGILFLSFIGLGLIYWQRDKWFGLKNRSAFWAAMTSLILIMVLMMAAWITGGRNVFLIDPGSLRTWYGFYIGAAFSGVIGVGFYPILGSRVWCRYGCPMAAILGLQQKWFSRFRITTNGGQCISCGNCSTYCEMGIDVKSYAQRGENIVRASCVGCGICSAVCPRGVLKLENGPLLNKTKDEDPIIIEEGRIRLRL
jgi:polyferredoxin